MDSPNTTIRVLLVDDELDFLAATQKALSRRGFDVATVASGPEALTTFNERDFDVVVLDVNMPEMDGYRLFYAIREYHPDTQIIMLTGHGSIQKAFELGKHGIFQYLGKPCDIDRLAESIRKAKAGADLRAAERDNTGEYPPDGERLEPIQVLLVDDEETFLRSITKVLERRGMHVDAVFSGAQALSHVAENNVDVAVVDIKMPGMDGLELLEHLKAGRPRLEVVLMTGHANVDSAVTGLKRGAYDYLLKPQDPDDLARVILAAANQKREMERADLDRKLKDILDHNPD
jgi:DNA-binding NtrC family response regulator